MISYMILYMILSIYHEIVYDIIGLASLARPRNYDIIHSHPAVPPGRLIELALAAAN
jgi:hypothetical protein